MNEQVIKEIFSILLFIDLVYSQQWHFGSLFKINLLYIKSIFLGCVLFTSCHSHSSYTPWSWWIIKPFWWLIKSLSRHAPIYRSPPHQYFNILSQTSQSGCSRVTQCLSSFAARSILRDKYGPRFLTWRKLHQSTLNGFVSNVGLWEDVVRESGFYYGRDATRTSSCYLFMSNRNMVWALRTKP